MEGAAQGQEGPADEDDWRRELRRLLDEGAPTSSAVKQVAGVLGVPRKQVYAAALEMAGEGAATGSGAAVG